jgi:2-phospho-L-lactate guanylyltransferase
VTLWTVVLPVKRLAVAKSRLRATLPLPPGGAEELVLAMALDTAAAALACGLTGRVLAITDDRAAASALSEAGAECCGDVPGGLNASVAHGAGRAAALNPTWGIAVLGADLPALRPAELAEALAACTGRAHVADAAGSGTTLLAAPPGTTLNPAFGPGSAAAHAASGSIPLSPAWPSLRTDVDTAADLRAARRLGIGPHTAAALTSPHDHAVQSHLAVPGIRRTVSGTGHAGHAGYPGSPSSAR